MKILNPTGDNPKIYVIATFLAILVSVNHYSNPLDSTKTNSTAVNHVKIPIFLQSVTKNSAVICWEWDESVAAQVVYGNSIEYGETTPIIQQQVNHIKIDQLKPGTKYFYNVQVENKLIFQPAKEYYFYTAPAEINESFTFAVIGDTRSGEESFDYDHRTVVESILTQSFPVILLHTGDLIDITQSDAWEIFFQIEADLLRQCPIYPARGISDGDGSQILKQFNLPGNSQKLWYSFTYGAVFFICLDIQEGKSDKFYKNQIGSESEQFQWLKQELTRANQEKHEFIIVYFHAPIFPADGAGSALLKNILHPLFKQHHVNLVLNGQHYFSYFQEDEVVYIISGGGGALLKQFEEKNSHFSELYFPTFHHLRIKVEIPALTIDAIDNTGSLFFNHTLISDLEKSGLPSNENNLAGSSEPARKTSTIDSIRLDIYSTVDCLICDTLKHFTIPRLQDEFISQIIHYQFYDVDSADNYEKFLRLELKSGATEHSLPALVINQKIFSGAGLTYQNLNNYIRGLLSTSDSNNSSEMSPNNKIGPLRSYKIYWIIGLFCLLLLGSFFLIKRYLLLKK